MLLAPLDLARRACHRWHGAAALWPLVSRGTLDDRVSDTWRSYLVDVHGCVVVPPTPTEPSDERGLACHGLARKLVAVQGSLALDGAPLTPGAGATPSPGSRLDGVGRLVLVEQLDRCDPAPGAELVELRRARRVRGESVLVLSGRLALTRRLGGRTVIPPDHLALGCTGELRPASTTPWLVLVGEGV